MTPQERRLIDDLFDRLTALESSPRDPEAEKAIIEGLRRAPNAAYTLVQTVLVQDEALKRANARIEELQAGTQQQPAASGSFLDSMRDAVFGNASRGSVPSVKPADPAGSRPVWNSGQVLNSGYNDPRAGYGADPRGGYGAAPYPAPGGGGGSFLGTAAAAAAGVIGGSLLMNSIRGLMGGGMSHQAFGDAGSFGSGSAGPWSGDASNSDLAREAGLNDIGGGGTDRGKADDRGHGLFDTASSDDLNDQRQDDQDDNDDGGFDSDDGSDYA